MALARPAVQPRVPDGDGGPGPDPLGFTRLARGPATVRVRPRAGGAIAAAGSDCGRRGEPGAAPRAPCRSDPDDGGSRASRAPVPGGDRGGGGPRGGPRGGGGRSGGGRTRRPGGGARGPRP